TPTHESRLSTLKTSGKQVDCSWNFRWTFNGFRSNATRARPATSDMWKKLHRNLAELPKPEIDLLHKSFVRMDTDADGCARY
ncbi:MAG: hypothetical protein ACPIOQ_67195, partial [Promethearchaeia archaeon]